MIVFCQQWTNIVTK